MHLKMPIFISLNYGKANDASPIHDSCAWAYWLRGTAVLCQLNQELTDRMIPIYFSGLGNVGPETMSANLEQDKTGQSTKPHNVSTQTAEDLSVFSKGQKLPYITAVHLYAMDSNDEDIRVFCPNRGCKHKKFDTEAPRYQIDFCGLGAYANITEPDKVVIRALLNHSKNFVFDNHPRPFCVPSMRQMLPVLANHADATKWFGGYDRNPEHRPKENEKGKKRVKVADLDSNSDSDSNIRKRAKKRPSEPCDPAQPSKRPQGQVATTLPPKPKRGEATRTSARFRN